MSVFNVMTVFPDTRSIRLQCEKIKPAPECVENPENAFDVLMHAARSEKNNKRISEKDSYPKVHLDPRPNVHTIYRNVH